MINQKVIPVITSYKSCEKFIETTGCWCILMDFHINILEELMLKLHQHQKKCFVHMDLIHGIAADEFGTQFLCQRCKADGIISIKPKVIECAKKHHKAAVLRLFLIDSRSIEKGCSMAEKLKPDYLEVLPATTKEGIQRVKAQSSAALIAGGLISSIEDIEDCFHKGAEHVTTSSFTLYEAYQKHMSS